ncbi:MAG: ATPase [Candidatus Marinimicrobia bacterium]|nr:ATPase [Candidatus Neomarinimicrobiota bacterium]|tara:strand:- start:18742 stop:20088 length:1347 start_codon:yes stop_codon:yes gene_type:complete
MNSIRIANGQGFWGDNVDAPSKLIHYGDIDYLTLDYLAEVTMSIMQRQKIKNPEEGGYATDFVKLIDSCIDEILSNKIKIIANAGGVNPHACKKALLEIANKKKLTLKVAIIKGDDIYNDIDTFIDNGEKFSNLYTGESVSLIREHITSANVYIDSFSAAEALAQGADIVLCGRISDPGLVVAPCIYEFGWSKSDFNKLASATVAGHIVECGAQCTGGNFSKWMDVQNLENIGYPIASVNEDGTFQISKPDNTGGLINRFTVSEQILYELGDPKCYISPDVCVDFTSFKLEEVSDNVVGVKGVKGYAPTDTYKVSFSYFNGYKASGQLTVSAPNALQKAKKSAEIIWKNLEALNLKYDKTCTEFLGLSSCHQSLVIMPDYINEIVLRLGVKSNAYKDVLRFTKELAPLITSGPPGITGFSEGRPKVKEVVAYWPSLINKNRITTKVEI